jgi:hypothetical protein
VRWWLALCGLALTATAAARVAGADGSALGALQLVPTTVLLLAAAAAVDAALAPVTPGATDNASGVAAALALHAELTAQPLARLSPGLVLFGDLRAHLRREKLDTTRAVVVELGPCGGGTPVWHARHQSLRRAAAGVPEARRAPWATPVRRLPTLALAALDERGIVPRARTAADTPDAVDLTAVHAAVTTATTILAALDAELP